MHSGIKRVSYRYLLALALLLFIHSFAFTQNVSFLNKTGLVVWVQKRNMLEQGFFPYTLEANDQYQTIPLSLDEPAILNMIVVPVKGPYGTADGIYFLLKPGDSLIVTADADRKPVLTHKSNPKRTHELTFGRKHMEFVNKTLPYTLYGFNGNTTLSKRIWSNDLKTRDRLLDSLYRPYMNTTEKFCQITGIDPAIGKLYKSFYWGNMVSDKLFADRQIDYTFEKSVYLFYQDSVLSWSKFAACQDCNNIFAYKNALRKIFFIRFAQRGELGYLDAVAGQTTGKIRDFLLSRYLMDRMEMTGDPEKLLTHYDQLCENKQYKTWVHDNYEFHARQSKISTDELATLVRPDKSEIGFTQLLNQLKGNVIYIDFWASWCGPCVAEFPASHQLKEQIKDPKIKMMYLSVDTDFNNWVKAAEKHKVNGDLSFILNNPDKNELVKKINLGPIPRYIIIDKQGNIVRLDAQRPSDPEIYTTLQKILADGK